MGLVIMHETEQWREIPGYEGFYEVSNYGQVRSMPRTVKATNRILRYKQRVLKHNLDSSGYAQVCLCNHTKRKTTGVHRLVALAFIGECPEGMEVCHWDGDKTNNYVGNLRYGTRAENVADNVRNGTHNWLVDGRIIPPTVRDKAA